MQASDDFAQGVEIIPGRLYFVWVRRPDSARTSHIAASNIAFTIDDELLYEPFFADFGPLNLGKAFRFCAKCSQLLQEADRTKKKLYFYCGPHAQQKANAAVLVGIYQVLFLNRTADDAFKPLQAYKPYVPFRDASCGVSTFHLTVYDCLKGIQKARDVGFIDWNSGSSTWNLEEYEHYEQVENGDLNWIVPGKFVAFSGPAARGNEIVGYRLYTPEDYWDYFRKKGVTTIVRLNKKVYDAKRFTDGGFKHRELYFPDGSCPSDAILFKFLELAENEPGCLAVHCKAGLGRTGVLICCYMMKHYRFTAEEVIGYIRICRPGSVIGPQQNYLREVEARMWHEGEIYRQQRGLPPRGISVVGQQGPELVVNGRGAADFTGPEMFNLAAVAMGKGAAGIIKTGRTEPVTPPGAVTAAAVSPADLSLLQYKSQYTLSSASSTPASGSAASTPHSTTSNASSSSFSSSTSYTSYSSNSASANGAATRNKYGHRSITPLRYGMGSAGSLSTVSQVTASHPPPQSAPTSYSASSVTRSMPAMGLRSPSADRGTGRSYSRSDNSMGSITGQVGSSILRATLHTDTLQAADRPRTLPERNVQSTDLSSSSWKITASPAPVAGQARSPSTSRTPAASTGTPTSGVVRVLAPNGQPRKVPAAMLGQYQQAAQASQGSITAAAGISKAVDSGFLRTAAQYRYGLSSK